MKDVQPTQSPRAIRFVEEYAKDRNGTQAAIRAGYSVATAGAQASTLLKNPKVQALLSEQLEKVGDAALFGAVEVLREWVMIATADPTKIVRNRQLNCRHCWGLGHEYQWSAREYAKACDDAARHVDRKGQPAPLEPPSCAGGFDWTFNRTPHPSSPECRGEGVADTYFEDMSKLGPAERRLIAGIKMTKDGCEVKMRDQDGALAKIAQHLGLLVEKRELTGKNGGPLVAAVVPVDLPGDAQALGALYSQIVGGS